MRPENKKAMSNITSVGSPTERQGTPLVLVADDEPSMLELVARHLKTMHDPKLEVIEASDGETAWRLAREHLPDLVVLDVMMPGMSGWEVCRKIREDVALAHTGVVMLTGIGENLNQMTSPLYGADAYIDKPFDFEELDEKVKTALEARASQREGVSRPVMNGVGGMAKAAKAKGTVKKAAPKASAAAKPKAKAKAVSAAKAAPKRKAANAKSGAKSRAAAKGKAAAAKKAPLAKGKAKAAKKPTKAPAKAAKTATKRTAKKPAKKGSKKRG
jgi:DNA-binding response OmpR family regulator